MIAVFGGLGRMGSRYCSTLSSMGKKYDIIDTKNGSIHYIEFEKYKHFIIATPNDTHSVIYHTIRKYSAAPILIEKPVVDSIDDMDILNDPDVFSGMIRRHDPKSQKILDFCSSHTILDVYFFKTGPKPVGYSEDDVKLDLSIHNIDLCYAIFGFLSDNMTVRCYYHPSKNDTLLINADNGDSLFIDFNLRTKTEYKLPLKNELKSFLSGGKCNAYKAHLECLS